jgi:hypothetical protein
MWSTFMWILSDYGRDWIYMQDEIFSCVFEFKVAYLCRWDNSLLDPNVMVCTEREIGSCRYCGEALWCVRGAHINKNWQFICNHCLLTKHENFGNVDDRDARLRDPSCPHWKAEDGAGGSCTATCPHSGVTPEKVWDEMEEHGAERLEAYRTRMRELGGRNPRQIAGQTVDDIVDHFK